MFKIDHGIKMNNRTKQKILFDDRFVRAVVTSIDVDIMHLRLPNDFAYGSLARMRREDFPQEAIRGGIRRGAFLNVFLIKPSERDSTLWHASGLWADRQSNPWVTSKPSLGHIVKGRVIRYIKDYAAVVKLQSGIDAFLHIKDCPVAGYANVVDHICIGDNIEGLVSRVNFEALEVDIDVNGLLDMRRREEVGLRERETMLALSDRDKSITYHCQSTGPQSYKNDSLSSVNVLIIDDDQGFVVGVKNWLKLFDAKVVSHLNLQAIYDDIRLNRITHILLDYDIGDVEIQKQIWTLLKKTKIPVAIVSGNRQEAPSAAKINSWPYFIKPINFVEIIDWFCGKAVDQVKCNERVEDFIPLWECSSHERQVLIQANAFLSKICEKTNCQSALWIKKTREGVYSIRAWCNIDRRKLESLRGKFAQSIFSTALENNIEVERNRFNDDPVWFIAPDSVNFCWSWPVEYNQKVERVVSFFSAEKMSDECKNYIKSQHPRFENLISNLEMSGYLSEIDAFASIGRASSGLAHELRGLANTISILSKNLALELNEKSALETSYVKSKINKICYLSDKLENLARMDLRYIQKERRKMVHIQSTISHIVDAFEHVAKGKGVKIVYERMKNNISTNIQPQVFEQPLINLIDNSLHHIGGRKWGRIIIKTTIDFSDMRSPLHIHVADNGFGIDASQLPYIFQPRYTSKSKQGFGLGLYVSKNLLNSIGGDLELVSSTRWIGSEFCIKLPIVLEDAEKNNA